MVSIDRMKVELERCTIYPNNKLVIIKPDVNDLSEVYLDLKSEFGKLEMMDHDMPMLNSFDVFGVAVGWLVIFKNITMVSGKKYKEGVYEVK